MRVPPEMLTGHLGGLVTAVTEPTDGRFVMMLDVERVLSETTHYDDEAVFQDVKPMTRKGITVFFADDSAVARKQIQRTLDLMHVAHVCALDGRQAWEKLQEIAAHAEATGRPVKDLIQAVLTDVEMPEMDDEAHQFACRRYRITGYRAQAVEERLRLLADQLEAMRAELAALPRSDHPKND